MKHHMMTALSLLFTVFFTGVLFAQQGTVSLDQKSKMWLEGTSTLHDFTLNVSHVKGTASVVSPAAPHQLQGVNITIPVANIKSGKDAMDENLYEALNAEDHPEINYQLVSIRNVKTEGSVSTLHTEGTLTINGTTKVIPMTVTGKTLADGTIQIDGAKKILMTDFGVTPPTMFLGTVKTGNEITVRFSIVIAQHGTEVSIK